MNFQEVEQKYQLLLESRNTGKISADQFAASISELRLMDVNKRWWQINPEDGSWFYWDGKGWVKPPKKDLKSNPNMTAPGSPAAAGINNGPQSLLDLLPLIIKSLLRGIVKKIIIALLIMILVWVTHTYLMAYVNDGFYKVKYPLLAMVLAMQGGKAGGALFWTLSFGILVSIYMRLRTKGFRQLFIDFTNTPSVIKSSLDVTGKIAPLLFFAGSIIALIFSFYFAHKNVFIANRLVSMLSAFALLICISNINNGFLFLLAKLVWQDASRLLPILKTWSYKPQYIVTLLFGMAVGLILATILPFMPWTGYLSIALLFVAAILALSKRLTAPSLFLCLFFTVTVYLFFMKQDALACYGGYWEYGGSWDAWLNREGGRALYVMRLGLAPAAGAGLLGYLTVTTISDLFPRLDTGSSFNQIGATAESTFLTYPDEPNIPNLENRRNAILEEELRIEKEIIAKHSELIEHYKNKLKESNSQQDNYREARTEGIKERIKEHDILLKLAKERRDMYESVLYSQDSASAELKRDHLQDRPMISENITAPPEPDINKLNDIIIEEQDSIFDETDIVMSPNEPDVDALEIILQNITATDKNIGNQLEQDLGTDTQESVDDLIAEKETSANELEIPEDEVPEKEELDSEVSDTETTEGDSPKNDTESPGEEVKSPEGEKELETAEEEADADIDHDTQKDVEKISDEDIFSDQESAEEALKDFTCNNRWDTLSLDDKKLLVDNLADYSADLLGIEDKPKIEYYYNESDADFGNYDTVNNIVKINEYRMENPNLTAQTTAHEMTHAWQWQRSQNPVTEVDKIFADNFSNYIESDISYDGYKNQPIEAHADEIMNRFKNKIEEFAKKRGTNSMPHGFY